MREAIVKKKLTSTELAAKMSEAELFEFLFLPGFTLKETVTKISGRGVGLDVVRDMVKQVRGTVSISSQVGKGTRFHLHLPLTLSVARMLLVEIAGEPYAFPLPYITRTLKLLRASIESLEGRQHFEFEGQQIGLITAHQILGRQRARPMGEVLPVVVVEKDDHFYGVAVDRFLGERELVVHSLDVRLGKIKDISAGALMEDGSPLLIIDVEDLIHSVGQLIASGPLNKVHEIETNSEAAARKKEADPDRGRLPDRARTGAEAAGQRRLRRRGGRQRHGRLECGSRRTLRSRDQRHRHAAHGWDRVGQAH